MNKQPRALYLLNIVSMWECFSYYGMRVLLLLFLIDDFGYTESEALSLYALYTTFVELGGILGGFLADRYLGLQASIVLGGVTIAAGHLCLSQHALSSLCFLFGLGCIIIGTALFRSNVAALVGSLYAKEDSRRESGYTLYYAGINFGGLLASVLCGVVAKYYGWSWGFGLAGIGMLLGLFCLYLGRRCLGISSFFVKKCKMVILGLLSSAGVLAVLLHMGMVVTAILALCSIVYIRVKHKEILLQKCLLLRSIGGIILCLVIFYACEEQLGSSLLLFAEKYVNRGAIPTTSLQAINPLTILCLGITLAMFVKRWKTYKKLSMSFFLLSCAFLLLAWQGSSLWVFMLAIVLLSLGELFMGPTAFALVAKQAPEGMQGLFMGALMTGFSMASFLGGVMSRMIVNERISLLAFEKGFYVIGCVACFSAVGIWKMYRRKYARVMD